MEWEWNAHGMQICQIEVNVEKNRQETLLTTNWIEEAIIENNHIFSGKWEATHDQIDCRSEEHCLLQAHIVDLEGLLGLQQTALQHHQNTIAGLEETIAQLVTLVKKLEKTVCHCHDRLLSSGPHYVPGEEKEGEEDEEESSLEYETNTPSKDSYMTPPSTGGRSKPSLAPSHSPTLEDSDPETSVVLCIEELEAHIKAFLEEAEEDMEMSDLPLLENVSPVLVPAPAIPGFVPFAVSTGQHCVPPKSLLRKVWHPYQDSVG